MNDKEILREIMQASKVSSPMLAERLNYKTASGVTEKLRRKESMRVNTFASFLKELGADIIIRHGDMEYPLSYDKGGQE